MSHLLVAVSGGSFFLGYESPSLNPVTFTPAGSGWTGGAAVLNDRYINAQYGWLVSGFWGPPAGAGVWIRVIDQSEGLDTFLGRPYFGMDQYAPVFGTEGSADRLRWDGVMLHNYYAVDHLGTMYATYEVYFGDESGDPIPGTATPAQIDATFEFGDPDVNADGLTDVEDLYAWYASTDPVDRDTDGDGDVDAEDARLLENTIRLGESEDMAAGRR